VVAIVECSIDISRRPNEVFSYATDLSRYAEWQPAVVSARAEGGGPPAVGSRAAVTRWVGPRKLAGTEEITELDPPTSWTVRGVSGPFVAIAKGAIQPLEEGESSRVTISLEFEEAHGIGKLLVGLVVRRARKTLARNVRELKKRLER
jgi:carbon monoxide dehydrogenase subunit G